MNEKISRSTNCTVTKIVNLKILKSEHPEKKKDLKVITII